MSGNLSDQFNNDPVSTTIHTTSYTIPSGAFARVKVTQFSSDFKIDSNIAIHSHDQSGSASMGISGTKYSNNTGVPLIGSMYTNSGTTFSVQVRQSSMLPSTKLLNPYTSELMELSDTTVNFTQIFLAPNDIIYVANNGNNTLYWNLGPLTVNHETTFWVPEGTLLEGDTFVVELYNKQGA